MPTIDMPTQSGVASKPGFGTGIPTPVLLAVVGGGIGLVVFLSRKSGTPGDSSQGTLLPNTAIMLGSLQQSVLETMGKVTTGNADLSSQLTGVGENLGSQIDTQSAGIQQSFADLNTYLGGNFQTLASSEASLSSAIAGLGTQNAGLADSLTNVLKQLYGVSTGISNVSGGINQLQGQVSGVAGQVSGVAGQVNTVSGQIGTVGAQVTADYNSLLSMQNQLQSQLNGIGNKSAPMDFSLFNNSFIYSAADSTTYKVVNGSLYDAGFWARSNFPGTPSISTNSSASFVQ